MAIALLAALLAAAAPAQAQAARDIDAAQKQAIDSAAASLRDKEPDVAVTTIEPVITAYQAYVKGLKGRIYCGMSGPQTLAYLASPEAERGAVAVTPAYCEALYIKGFALIDLKQVEEARQVYDQLLVLAPLHAHFITELAQSYRIDGNWPKMLELCQKSAGLAGLASPGDVAFEKGFALRCQGFALIEQGELDEAETVYRQCVALDPNDEKAKHELEYIAEQRGKKS